MMTIFSSYMDIPAKYRRLILDETGMNRVSKVPLEECERIVDDYEEQKTLIAKLAKFEVIIDNGRTNVQEFEDIEKALVALDVAVQKDSTIVAMLKQADKVIRAFVDGEWIYSSQSKYQS